MKTNAPLPASKCPKPSVKDLALLAATLCKNVQTPPDQLAQVAFDLWLASDSEIARRNAKNWQVDHETAKADLIESTLTEIDLQHAVQASQEGLQRPSVFHPSNKEYFFVPPSEKRTSFQDALANLMPTVKSYTERLPKFKRYLAHSMNCNPDDKRIIKNIEQLQKNGVTEQWYNDVQLKFHSWFQRDMAESRKISASNAAKKRHSNSF